MQEENNANQPAALSLLPVEISIDFKTNLILYFQWYFCTKREKYKIMAGHAAPINITGSFCMTTISAEGQKTTFSSGESYNDL